MLPFEFPHGDIFYDRETLLTVVSFYGLEPSPPLHLGRSQTKVFRSVSRTKYQKTLPFLVVLLILERHSLAMMSTLPSRLKQKILRLTQNIFIASVTALPKLPVLLGRHEQLLIHRVSIEHRTFNGDIDGGAYLFVAPAHEVNGGKPLVMAVFSCSQYQAGVWWYTEGKILILIRSLSKLRMVQCVWLCSTQHKRRLVLTSWWLCTLLGPIYQSHRIITPM